LCVCVCVCVCVWIEPPSDIHSLHPVLTMCVCVCVCLGRLPPRACVCVCVYVCVCVCLEGAKITSGVQVHGIVNLLAHVINNLRSEVPLFALFVCVCVCEREREGVCQVMSLVSGGWACLHRHTHTHTDTDTHTHI
jgi:hypothetical protein